MGQRNSSATPTTAAPPPMELATDDILQFQCFSDIHIEFRHGNKEQYKEQSRLPTGGAKTRRNTHRFVIPQRRSPYLALLGDIGTEGIPYERGLQDLTDFIMECCDVFDQVWYVPGNHEGYGGSYDGVVAALQAIENKLGRNRFALLDCSSLDIPNTDIRVLGCTLWTYVPPSHQAAVSGMLNDFNRIADMTIDRYVAEHDKCVKWLEQECVNATKQGKRIIILTHHAPTVHGTWRRAGREFPPGYAEKLLNIICSDLVRDQHAKEDEQLKIEDVGITFVPPETPIFNATLYPTLLMWCFGHTHWNLDAMQCGVRLVSNQIGYPDDENAKTPGHVAHDMNKVLCVDRDGKTTPESMESQARRMKK